MDFKKRMLQIFASKVNQEFGEYKQGYQQILRDTTVDIEDSQASGSSATNARTELYVKCEEDDNLSFQRGTIDSSNIADDARSRDKSNAVCQAIGDGTEPVGEGASRAFSSKVDSGPLGLGSEKDSTKKPEEPGDAKSADTNGNFCGETGAMKTRPVISKCTVDETLLGDESRLFDNSMNMHCVNQTFLNGEFRRKARRRTGRLVIKRKYQLVDDFEDVFKRPRTDRIASFYELYKEAVFENKESAQNRAYFKEFEDLKSQLRAAEELLKKRREKEEQEEVDRVRQEGLEASKRIELEMEKLLSIKKDIGLELKKIETEKKRIQEEKDRLHAERLTTEKKRLEEEFLMESKRLDAEKTMIADEKKRLEEFKLFENKRLEEERLKIEVEKLEELRRIQASREGLELKLIEETKKIQLERKLIEEEREKINQTFLEITSRSVCGPLKPREVKIQLPPLFQSGIPVKKYAARTAASKPLSELFFDAKREHAEKINQTLLVLSENAQNTVEKPKPIFGKTAQKPFQGTINVEKMNPHSLYKTSIDAQTVSSDPKKYIPKIPIPFYTNEDEFDSESKKFPPALFTKDPKLNFMVKSQSHEGIRAFFGSKKDIDVETIFSEIENVSNQSPNKLRRKS